MSRSTPGTTLEWAAAKRTLDAAAAARPGPPPCRTALELLHRTEQESAHRDMLAWLLDPVGDHGLGAALLAALLRRTGRPDLAARPGLHRTLVDTEHDLPATPNAAHRRADLVLWTSGTAVVVELKVKSSEHTEQTADLAAHFAHLHRPHFVFLTLTGEPAAHPEFVPLRLRALAHDLRTHLAATPGAAPHAHDYLATLERMHAVTPSDEAQARFWIRHGRLDFTRARRAAFELLEDLPDRLDAALDALAPQLGADVTRTTFEDHAQGRSTDPYPERVGLLTRPTWRGHTATPLAGIGYGFRSLPFANPDRMLDEHQPFYGLWLTPPAPRAAWPRLMRPDHWSSWADWDYLDLAFADTDTDLLALYASRFTHRTTTLWHAHAAALDKAVAG
ncbi:PD-(D/E)XK nuclease family protein [Kitasatospora sp. NPDC048545]|uniref:PD-(D/E)XK nuclease family protein n=1 Tax=Kitasatospora sp. NPDC048545 TaxID=3157208 RepID=UPI0033DA1646